MFKQLQTKIMLLLVMILGGMNVNAQSDYSADYEGNVTLSTTNGTNASECAVKIDGTDYDGIKAGTSKKSGAVAVTVPSGTKYLHIHAAGWSGETVTLSVSPTTNLAPTSISLTADSGISGNGTTFTLSGTLSDYYKVITFTNALTQDTQLTFTSGKRFVIWGVTSETDGAGLADNDLALTGSPVTLNFDLYNSASAQTVSYTTSSEGAITVSGSDYVTTVVDENAKTISVTPKAVTSQAETITVNQTVSSTHKPGSVTFTVNVTDSRPTYTVTYKANGGVGDDIVKTYRQGTNVTIEGNTFTYAGHRFVKWNTATNGTGTDYQVDGSIENIQANVELFAQWEEVYEVTYDFTQIDGFSDWTSSYSEHVVDYADATVTFASANKQTTTITNQPVTKGGAVELVMTDGSTLATATFVCTQWGTKEQTITLHYSTDGGENYTSTDITSEDFTISSDNLPAGTNAVKITFSNASNQVGIASATVLKVPEIEITNNNEIAYNATSGSFNFSITHPAGGTMTVSEDVDWISNAAVSGNTVTFTTTANKELSQARNGVITLTYTYNGNKTVTKEVTVTQAAPTATITLNAACTDGTLIYGTYYSDKAYVMNEMLEGQVVSVDADGKLVVQTAYEGGEVVPANTALLIATADEFTGTKEYTITLSTGGDDLSEFNMLKGTLTADEMTTGDNCLFYRLTMHNGTQIGFWWGAADGAAFKPGANKAYLAVPAEQAKAGFAFEGGDATEIVLNALKGEQNGETYNLQGQKVGSEYKGIVIVNGKKFINK